MADKQYYTNLNPGETTIESRLGAKILMNDGLTINASRRAEYLDQLRQENYQGNINLNMDEETSIVYMGTGQVNLNQQGNTNQQSINLENQNNITAPIRTPGEMPAEEVLDPPTITNVTPLEGYRGDPITIEGTGFIDDGTIASFGGAIAGTTEVITDTKLIAAVGNGADGKVVVRTSAGLAIYTNEFNFLGVRGTEDEELPEEEVDELDPLDQDESENLPDSEDSPDEQAASTTPEGCPQPGAARPARIDIVKTIRPCDGPQCYARDRAGNIVALYDFVVAAKTCVGISTGCPDITKSPKSGTRGGLGCGMGVSIIYSYACGHSMKWVDKRNSKPIIGTNLSVTYGTYSIYEYLKKDTTNFETIEIYRGQGINYWNTVAVKLLQPGDVINTRTDGKINGHIGFVIDTQTKHPGTWDIISNSSSAYNPTLARSEGTILLNYSGYHWGNGFGSKGKYKIATKSGVGPTFVHRFKCGRGAEWGKTIAISPQ